MGKAKATKDSVKDLVDKSLEVSKDSKKAYEKKSYFVNSVHTAAKSYKTEYKEKWIEAYKSHYYGNDNYGYTDDDGNFHWTELNRLEQHAISALNAACDELNQLASDLEQEGYNPTKKAKNLVEKFSKANGAITAFERHSPDLAGALEDGSKVTVEKVTAKDKDGNDYEYEAYVVDVDGKKVPISEAVNAAYTEYGTAANAAVAYASATNEENWSDEDLDSLLGNVHKNLGSLVGTGMYNVASKEDQEGLYKELRQDGWPVSLEDLAAKLGEGDSGVWGALDLGDYGKYLTGLTGADDDESMRNLALTGLGLAVGLGSGFNTDGGASDDGDADVVDDKEKEEEKSWSDGTNTSPGGSSSGGTSGSSSSGGTSDSGFKTPKTDVDKGDETEKTKDDDTKAPDLLF